MDLELWIKKLADDGSHNPTCEQCRNIISKRAVVKLAGRTPQPAYDGFYNRVCHALKAVSSGAVRKCTKVQYPMCSEEQAERMHSMSDDDILRAIYDSVREYDTSHL